METTALAAVHHAYVRQKDDHQVQQDSRLGQKIERGLHFEEIPVYRCTCNDRPYAFKAQKEELQLENVEHQGSAGIKKEENLPQPDGLLRQV